MAKCKDCKWKPGLDDEWTACLTCNGTGEVSEKPKKESKDKIEVRVEKPKKGK